MLGTDRDALICDLAETYNIYDLNSVPLMLLATLSAGLHDDSRIKMKLNNLSEVPAVYTLVHIADALTILLGALANEKNTPALYYDMMTGKRKVEHIRGFNSIEDFNAAREKIIHG